VEIDKNIDTNDFQVVGVSLAGTGLLVFLEPVAIVLYIIAQSLLIAYLIRKHIKLNNKK